MAKKDQAVQNDAPVPETQEGTAMVADARDSEARTYFADHPFPSPKPDYLTRQQYGMLVEHVQGGQSYEATGAQFLTTGDVARGVILKALSRVQEQGGA